MQIMYVCDTQMTLNACLAQIVAKKLYALPFFLKQLKNYEFKCFWRGLKVCFLFGVLQADYA